jgi:hypothetical protein
MGSFKTPSQNVRLTTTKQEHFSSLLPTLKSLTYLFLTRQIQQNTTDAHERRDESSIFPGVHGPIEIAHHFVRAIKEKCPSLQYIRISNCVWQCIVEWNHERKEEEIRLLRLEWEEILTLEFLPIDTINMESGLPMKHWHPPFYD